jgi:hypothetical protein
MVCSNASLKTQRKVGGGGGDGEIQKDTLEQKGRNGNTEKRKENLK